jgi:hypothetical protein
MSFSINDIRSKLNPVRPTLFEVTITFGGLTGGQQPAASASSVTNDLQDFKFYCRSSSVPASVVGQIEVPYFGRMMKIPGDRIFENWSVQVYNDERLQIRNAFETWSSTLNSMRNNQAAKARPLDLKGSATIIQYSKEGTSGTGKIPINRYILDGLFPVNVGEMELSWEAQGQIQLFSVSFAYDDFVPDRAGLELTTGASVVIR